MRRQPAKVAALLLWLLLECTEAKKHCWYFEGLYPTYYICRSYEDCCGSRCCVRALSIQRTRDEPCREFHGNGFPGPTQLTPGECGLPSPSSLLQHASAPVRTGSEGQVAGCPRARGETGEGLSLAFLSPLMFTSRNGLMGH
ncbi:vesicular, overexpressed in cancer, prosurvival protein 1 isoform X3 [Hylobates moloch]|uniref:WW domain binding protein VOPP1 isoform X5 n=1 Tax=Symphalangus syndactylus TaxID=9590 RepID=UPI00244167FC|nr:vesicular, overexpressed in cancer, prosurvival protein 1 isoform X4 [Symphalangus syndactylus]XP_058300730.1 vesicular, overexpressed in cancer, prosurvival protein 1 isoform X3 [Hylobates moloch]